MRVDFEHLAEGFDGGVQLAHIEQGMAEIVMRLDEVRFQPQRLAKGHGGFFKTPQIKQHGA